MPPNASVYADGSPIISPIPWLGTLLVSHFTPIFLPFENLLGDSGATACSSGVVPMRGSGTSPRPRHLGVGRTSRPDSFYMYYLSYSVPGGIVNLFVGHVEVNRQC